MPTQISDIERSIKRSLLLKPERKRILLSELKDMSQEKLGALQKILLQEDTHLDELLASAIDQAYASGDQLFFRRLDEWLKEAPRALRGAESDLESTDAENTLEKALLNFE